MATPGYEELFVLIDAVGVKNPGIRSGEAGPGGGTAQIGLCEGPERVALVDFDCQGGAGPGAARLVGCCDDEGKIKLGTHADLVGVDDTRIDPQEFVPAIATPEVLLR